VNEPPVSGGTPGDGAGPPDFQRERGWLQLPLDRRQQFWITMAAAGLMVLGGFGPWAKFGPISAAGTDGDGWFPIVAGLVAIALLVRLNSRRGHVDRLTWVVPAAGAVGAFVVLIDLVEILDTEFITAGWGAWLGAIAGLALVGAAISLLSNGGRRGLAIAATGLVAVAGVAVGATTSDEEGSSLSDSDSGEERSLFADSEPEEPEVQAPKVLVAEQGFSQRRGLLTYGVLLSNSSTDVAAEEVSVTLNVLDATGTVISTETAHITHIPPDGTFGIGGESSIEGERAADLEVTAEAAAGSKTVLQLPQAESVRLVDSDFGPEARAEITNSLSTPLPSIADVFFVFRDSSGEIIGGGTTYTDAEIPPGASAAVEETLSVPAAAADAEVYVDAEE
jgi:hypothetical protein